METLFYNDEFMYMLPIVLKTAYGNQQNVPGGDSGPGYWGNTFNTGLSLFQAFQAFWSSSGSFVRSVQI